MDQWLKTGSVRKRKLTETSNEEQCPSSDTDLTNDATHQQAVPEQLSVQTAASTSGGTMNKKRRYLESYINYGFTCTGEEDCPKPLCVVCGEVLSNGSMKPSLLTRHLATKHPEYKGKDAAFFQRLKRQSASYVKTYFETTKSDSAKATKASYYVSYHIARRGKNHTIGENLISPCMKDAVRCMLGEESAKKMSLIPLSNNTVSRRIQDMSDDVEATVISHVKQSDFYAIQADESTDVAQYSVLLVIVRFLKDFDFEEHLLLCHPLTGRTTGKDVFEAIDVYFVKKGIQWLKCVGLTTDGGKAMEGCYAGLRARVAEVAPRVKWTHCCIHRQSLASKPLPPDLRKVLDEAVKIVNFIKAKPTNSRLFKLLCEGMDSPHTTLLLHTEVRWLSRGKVLTRLFELRHEVILFFEEHPFNLGSRLHSSEWLQSLAYLSDIFQQVNKLNLSLQKSCNPFQVVDKIEAMKKKIDFWGKCILQSQPEVFETLHEFLMQEKLSLTVDEKIIQHLEGLKSSLEKYFPVPELSDRWISDPFNEEYFEKASLSISEKEKLLELASDTTLKNLFNGGMVNLVSFWTGRREEFSELAEKAIVFLLPFSSTELVERAFSSYAHIKNKYRSKLNAAYDLRLFLSSFEPNFEKLANSIQSQISH